MKTDGQYNDVVRSISYKTIQINHAAKL